jgi:RES domain-containing protein
MARRRGGTSRSGPSGNASTPPPWLRTEPLAGIVTYAAGTLWFRCHKRIDEPVFFGPAPGIAPKYRFDAPMGEYRVLYVGLNYEAAFIETLLRNPKRRTVDWADLDIRNITLLNNDRPLRLVQAHGEGLSLLGTTAALSTGGYKEARRYSLELWKHPDRPDGLIYASRHNPDHLCAAIFNRPHASFSRAATEPLLADERRIRYLLTAHGKSIIK